jgi:hypothetical protein
MTPLMFHASLGNFKIVKWFSKYMKNIGVFDNDGRNALFYAYGDNRDEIVKHLITCGEDPSTSGYRGKISDEK